MSKEYAKIISRGTTGSAMVGGRTRTFEIYATDEDWNLATYRYSSLGDSIAAADYINDNWDEQYGLHTQYGKQSSVTRAINTETVVVKNSYTDRFTNYLTSIDGESQQLCSCKSFASSGQTSAELLSALANDDNVKDAIRNADVITISIGANDILGNAAGTIVNYLTDKNATLGNMKDSVTTSLNKLLDVPASGSAPADGAQGYYTIIHNLVQLIQSREEQLTNQKPVEVYFLTTYNPYRYLWVDRSYDSENYERGYFSPVLTSIPNWELDNPLTGNEVYDIRKFIYEFEYNGFSLKTFADRVCDMGGGQSVSAWVETQIVKLNEHLKSAVNYYNKNAKVTGITIKTVDVKQSFDKIPRDDYRKVVNCEIFEGQTIADLDWGRGWQGLTLSDIGSIRLNNIVGDTIDRIYHEVIKADLDCHPKAGGHELIYEAIINTKEEKIQPRLEITYNANRGTSETHKQIISGLKSEETMQFSFLDNMFGLTSSQESNGYYFVGWNTKADGTGTQYKTLQETTWTVFQGSDEIREETLYAIWSNYYTITYKHSYDSKSHDSGDTGPMECYELWLYGAAKEKLGAFSNPSKSYSVPYGTQFGIVARTKSDSVGSSGRSYITLNGTTVAGKSTTASKDFYVRGNVTVNFEWNYWLQVDGWNTREVSYWNCYVSGSAEV